MKKWLSLLRWSVPLLVQLLFKECNKTCLAFKRKKLCFVARFGNKKRVPNWELFFYGSEIKLAGS